VLTKLQKNPEIAIKYSHRYNATLVKGIKDWGKAFSLVINAAKAQAVKRYGSKGKHTPHLHGQLTRAEYNTVSASAFAKLPEPLNHIHEILFFSPFNYFEFQGSTSGTANRVKITKLGLGLLSNLPAQKEILALPDMANLHNAIINVLKHDSKYSKWDPWTKDSQSAVSAKNKSVARLKPASGFATGAKQKKFAGDPWPKVLPDFGQQPVYTSDDDDTTLEPGSNLERPSTSKLDHISVLPPPPLPLPSSPPSPVSPVLSASSITMHPASPILSASPVTPAPVAGPSAAEERELQIQALAEQEKVTFTKAKVEVIKAAGETAKIVQTLLPKLVKTAGIPVTNKNGGTSTNPKFAFSTELGSMVEATRIAFIAETICKVAFQQGIAEVSNYLSIDTASQAEFRERWKEAFIPLRSQATLTQNETDRYNHLVNLANSKAGEKSLINRADVDNMLPFVRNTFHKGQEVKRTIVAGQSMTNERKGTKTTYKEEAAVTQEEEELMDTD
ncbi:hypothetical protein F5051DRAFT_427196, partial [Lentinula edodes]